MVADYTVRSMVRANNRTIIKYQMSQRFNTEHILVDVFTFAIKSLTLLQTVYIIFLLIPVNSFRPALVMTIIVLVLQTLLAKFAFLHERGALLAIDNRFVCLIEYK